MSSIVALGMAAASLAAAQGIGSLPGAGNVALPLEEYIHLTELAGKPAPKPKAPPLDFVMQRAEMKFEVSGNQALGTIRLDGEILAAGEVKVPLISGMTVFDARRQGSELPLRLEGATHTTILNGLGAFSIVLEAGVPLTFEPGRALLTLPAPSAGAVQLTLTIPGDHTNAVLTPGLITAKSSFSGRTTIEAILTGGQSAAISWATRENAAAPSAPREVRFLSDCRTLVTVGESQVALAALAEITVLQGEPSRFELVIPPGYEVTGATGPSVESSEVQSGKLALKVNSAGRTHHFLISLEKAINSSKEEVIAPAFAGAQRETGELLVETEGTMELSADELGGLKRMDIKETSALLRSMTRHPIQAAFRYHRQPGETPRLSAAWVRFPESGLLSAVAQSATVTTLVTGPGRLLTEIRLIVRNRDQPFLKVALPASSAIVSAEVGGQPVKPALGEGGSRVPLLRAGFRPSGAYVVSFVYQHSGSPFAKKGSAELALPRMDIPIGFMEWEIFMPSKFRLRDFVGNAIASDLLPRCAGLFESAEFESWPGSGDVSGSVLDPAHAAIPGARISVVHLATGAARSSVTDFKGQWMVPNVPPGRIRVQAQSLGFSPYVQEIDHQPGRNDRMTFVLQLGAVSESVAVYAMTAQTSTVRVDRPVPEEPPETPASANVINLQRRVAGVLPVPIQVPRTGNAYHFARPLVVDEETRLTFNYKVR